MAQESTKPKIAIFIAPDYKDTKLLDYIGYGAEEEGVPFKVEVKTEGDSKELAYQAAKNSKLGIGIGVANKRIVLQMEKLKLEQPVFNRELNDSYQAKVMGVNAARMVKGIAFKDFSQPKEYNQTYQLEAKEVKQTNEEKIEREDAEIEEITNLVKEVLSEMGLDN